VTSVSFDPILSLHTNTLSLWIDVCTIQRLCFHPIFHAIFSMSTLFLVDQCKESLSIFNYTTHTHSLSCRNPWNRHRKPLFPITSIQSTSILIEVLMSSTTGGNYSRPFSMRDSLFSAPASPNSSPFTKPQTWSRHYLADKLILKKTNTWTSSRFCRSLWIPWSARIVE